MSFAADPVETMTRSSGVLLQGRRGPKTRFSERRDTSSRLIVYVLGGGHASVTLAGSGSAGAGQVIIESLS